MTRLPDTRRKPEIKSQTAYRGLGAIIVMLAHFYLIRDGADQWRGPVQYYPNLGMAIDLFFVISGYIMAYIYADSFGGTITKRNVVSFLWARFTRAYPLYMFALIMFVAERGVQVYLTAHGSGILDHATPVPFFDAEDTPFSFATSVLLLQAWGVNDGLVWNYPSWALSAEFGAYLTFPFLCLLIARHRRLGPSVLIAGTFVAYVFLDRAFGTIDIPGDVGVLRCIPGFAFGVALNSLGSTADGASLIGRLSTGRLHAVQATALAALLLLGIVAEHQLFVVAAIGLLILVTSENRGWLCDLLTWSPLQFLGRISYSVYMMHVVAGLAVSPFLRIFGAYTGLAAASWWLAFDVLVKMAASVAVSMLTYQFIELPGRHLFRLKPKRRASMSASAPVPQLQVAETRMRAPAERTHA